MVAAEDLKFYSGGVSGLGGAITTTEIITSTSNGLFTNVPKNELTIGEDYYACFYFKNSHQSEQMDNLSFWLDFGLGSFTDTVIKWGFDAAGLNGTAQVIADKYTAPTSVTWLSPAIKPSVPNVGKLLKSEYVPVWVWWHVNANAVSRKDDPAPFRFRFFIPSGGSGSGGGGGEGPVMDKFGMKKIFNTKAGGEEWFSDSWANGNSRVIPENDWDPDEFERTGIARGSAATITINGDGTATASPGAVASTVRWFIKRGTSAGWLNTEITAAIRIRTSCDSIQFRSRADHHGVKDLPYGYDVARDISCGFGNYMVKWGDDNALPPDDTKLWQQVEVIQDLYSGHLDPHTWGGFTINVWQGFKSITRTIGGEVNVQGWFCPDLSDQTGWVKHTEFTYTGTNVPVSHTGHEVNVQTCIDADGSLFGGDQISDDIDKNTLWLKPSYWSWIRLVGNIQDTDLKWVSVREIEGQASTGGGGGGGNPGGGVTNWKVAIVGDEGCGSTTSKVRDLCKTYDYTVSVGDHAYASANCWTSTFSSLKPNFNSAYGNHEYQESGGVAPYKTFFGHDKTYFSFKFQNVHFLVVDTNISISSGSAQYNFVKADLEFTDSDSTIDWVFVIMHHPWLVTGSHHPANEFNQIQTFHQLFIDHHVNFVCCGHNHNWQRTHQISYNAGTPTTPTIVDSSAPYVASAAALIHVVSGTGGHDTGSSLYSLPSQPSHQAYQNRTHNGIWEVLASNNAKTLTCSFVDIDGSKFDTFVITTT